jgi:hypothetical protein
MSVFDRLRAWWNKDKLEGAEEKAHMTEHERDLADRDYQGYRDDVRVEKGRMLGGVADYERDSERPR